MRFLKVKYFITVLILIGSLQTQAQLAENTYWVQFSDKNQSNYYINQPEFFLSERALERRARYHIPIDSLDLPVNQWYVDSVRNQGALILNPSKWFNGTTVYINNPNIIEKINALPFAKVIAHPSFPPFPIDDLEWRSIKQPVHYQNETKRDQQYWENYDYGKADLQISMLNGKVLHQNNYRGQGMLIAVLDAGFGSGDLSFIAPLIENGQIQYTWDFVTQDSNVFNDHYHGKSVLSTMGAMEEGEIVGTAPLANYLLFRTENTASENLIEEFNWISACELADQMGADLINSSLGYHKYDLSESSYSWNDLNGETAPISIASNIVASKGILLFASAGNDGNNTWKKISPPADAEGCITIGAVNKDEEKAAFSSVGYTSDGRIKPDVVALGKNAYGISSTAVTSISGTSFSSPILCGMTACLWQVDKNKTNFEIKQLLKELGNQSSDPDSLLGYGIPNFQKAYQELTSDIEVREKAKDELMTLYPICFNNSFTAKLFTEHPQTINIRIFNMKGTEVYQSSIVCEQETISYHNISGLESLPSGMYIVNFLFKDKTINRKIIKK